MKNYCKDCGKEISRKTAIRCKKCYGLTRRGQSFYNYKDGYSLRKNKCIDCGIELSDYRAKRCKECDRKNRIGKPGNKIYKNGYQETYPRCSKCGKIVKAKTAKICGECYHSSLKNRHPANYKGGRPHCLDCGKLLGDHYSKRCHVCASKLRWSDPVYAQRQVGLALKALEIRPNKPETIVKDLLNKLVPNQFKYTGDGSVLVGRYNPDFIDEKNKKIIEVYGDYWHNLPDVKHKDYGRVKVYAQEGYKLLIIWEHELKEQSIIAKLDNFIRQGKI